MGRHTIASASIDHDRLGRAQPLSGACGVHRRVAPAVDDDSTSQRWPLPLFELVQHRHGVENLRSVTRRDLGITPPLSTNAHEGRVELPFGHDHIQLVDGAIERNGHAHLSDAFDLRIHDVARKSVGRDSVAQHAARQRCRFVYLDFVTRETQVIRRRQARGTRTHDQHATTARWRGHLDAPALLDRPITEEALDRIDPHGLVDLDAVARSLTRVEARPAHHRGHRIGLHDDAPSSLVVTLLSVVEPPLDILASRAAVVARWQAVDVDGSLDSPRTGLIGEARSHAECDGERLGRHSVSSLKSP